MKLPSLNYLFNKARASLRRFPATLLCSLISVCVAVYLTENNDDIQNYFPYINALITSALGIPLFFGLSIFISSQNYSLIKSIVSHAFTAALLAGIYFMLPDSDTTHNTTIPYIRYGIFNIIIHLLVSFSPYLKRGNLNGFWNFNKVLFIRFWTSVLYSGFLYVGLILALASLKLLFDIEIHDELYFDFYIVIIGLFNTWFFVSGIPTSLDELEGVNIYPNGLKIFSQYVLLPLLALYLIILYSYGIKIIVSWDWPKGIVSYLISCVSVLGILTVLLLHPYGYLKDNSWIKKFTRAFYFSLIPLIAILFIAIGFRVGDYGITINRYAIIALGVWLTLVTGYFSFNQKNIKLIPVSLAIILSLICVGPWSIFNVSEKSQINRLVSILESNQILQNGKVVNEVIWAGDSLPAYFHTEVTNTNENILSDSLHNEVMSIIDYLDSHHGFSGILHLYKQNLDSLIVVSLDSNKSRDESSIYMRSLGLPDYYKNTEYTNKYHSFRVSDQQLIQISSYDYFQNLNLTLWGRSTSTLQTDGDSVACELELSSNDNSLFYTSENDSFKIDLNEKLDELIKLYGLESDNTVSRSKMTVTANTRLYEIKFHLNTIGFQSQGDSIKLNDIQGVMLLKKHDE